MNRHNFRQIVDHLRGVLAAHGQTLPGPIADALPDFESVMDRPDRIAPALLAAARADATTPPDIAFRFLGMIDEQGNLIDRAIEAGLIDGETAAMRFYREAAERLGAHLIASGLDVRLSKSEHPTKGWVFFDHAVPVRRLLELETLPAAARRHLPLFEKLGYAGVTVLAVDPAGSMNTYYFGRQRFLDDPADIDAICRRLGLEAPPTALGRMSSDAVGLYPTYGFAPDERARRLCITCLDTPQSIARAAPSLREFCAYGDRLGGQVLSLVVGCTVERRAVDYRIKAEMHLPGLRGTEHQSRVFRATLGVGDMLGVFATLARRHPVALPLTVLAQLPGGHRIVRRLPRLGP